jgi:hypothetical protein
MIESKENEHILTLNLLNTKKPSEYIKNFYFTTQPMEFADHENLEFMEALFNLIDAEISCCMLLIIRIRTLIHPAPFIIFPFCQRKRREKYWVKMRLNYLELKNPFYGPNNV